MKDEQEITRKPLFQHAVICSVLAAGVYCTCMEGQDLVEEPTRDDIECVRDCISALQRVLVEADSSLVDLAASLPQEDKG